MIDIRDGNCLSVMASMPEGSVDAIVTDPPYHLSSIVRRFGAENAAPAMSAAQRRFAQTGGADRPPGTDQFGRLSKGFMGKVWDGGDIAFDPATWAAALRVLKPGGHMVAFGAPKNAHRLTCAIEDAGFEIRDVLMWVFGTGFPKSHNAGDGWGTALKPAYEPIVLARKPLIGTVAENVLRYGTGAINIDACRVATDENLNGGAYAKVGGRAESQSLHGGTGMNVAGKTVGKEFEQPPGRWPANLVHDGSDEVMAAFPDAPGQQRKVGPEHGAKPSVHTYGDFGPREDFEPRGDSGSAARFFYCAKAGKADRAGSKHPTVKPIALMRWLCRLITPPGGIILDPFAGTGTTGAAAEAEGFNAVLIEREAEYLADIRRRFGAFDLMAELA